MTTHSQIANTIDAIVTADIGVRGAIQPLHESHLRQSRSPPILNFSTFLDDTIQQGDTVIVTTGFPIPPTMQPETDGPPGTIALANLLITAYDATVILTTESTATEVCRVGAESYGLDPSSLDSAPESSLIITPFPTDPHTAEETAETLAAQDPTTIIAIEKAGPNAAGVYHNMRGLDVSEHNAKLQPLLNSLPDTPILAIGDGGNELGMRDIALPVKDQIQYGETCQCPCTEGIICAIPATHAVTAAVSNWGAYGIIAMISTLHETNYLHEPADEESILQAMSDAGAVDGINGGTTAWCDALPPTIHANIIELLNTIIDNAIE